MKSEFPEPVADTVDRYIDEIEAARILSLSRSYIRQLRLRGGGPRFCTFGRAVRYPLGELLAWARTRLVSSTSGRGAV